MDRDSSQVLDEEFEDESEDSSGMIEDWWDGDGSWAGGTEVAYSLESEGDAIFTLPVWAVSGTTIDGKRYDITVPIPLLRWVLDRVAEQVGAPVEE